MLKIHESTTARGEIACVFLRVDGDSLAIVSEEGTFALPGAAIDHVMARFGAPLDPREPLAEIATLDLGAGRSLRHVRHLARYDVIARDYVVYGAPGREPLCALATTVAGALEHLGRAASEPESEGSVEKRASAS
jgi:hypothetical protein